MDGVDFKYEARNSLQCHDVASLLRLDLFIIDILFIYLFNIRNGKPMSHLPQLSNFMTVTPFLSGIFKFGN